MKLKLTFLVVAAAFCLLPLMEAQNSIKITGGNVKITDNVAIVLKDCQLQNNGTLTATNGTVELKGTGTKAQSEIGGTGTSTFHNLKINKSSNDAQLGSSITVTNQLEMANGKLDLQSHTLTLGTTNGTLIGESETTHITSTSTGQISKTVDLNAPNAQNPGNLGIEITSAANLGSTEIRRGHNHQTVPSGTSIFRHFTITPTNNTGLSANFKFHYLDAELNGKAESGLVLMENNGGWMIDGFMTRDATNNTVSFSGYDGLYQYTLGANINDADMDGIVADMDNCPNDANADQADADNDMVGNVCDTCPNGDDMVDANNNSIVDDCECKTDLMNLTGLVGTDSVYVASNTIQSDENIPNTRKIVYKANSSINLKAGFHAATGTEFLATIATCKSPVLLKEPTQERIASTNKQVNEMATLAAYPNLISTNTEINYSIPSEDKISLSIQDLKGQQLALLVDNALVNKGHYQLDWSANRLPPGMYLLQLETGNQTITEKLVIAGK